MGERSGLFEQEVKGKVTSCWSQGMGLKLCLGEGRTKSWVKLKDLKHFTFELMEEKEAMEGTDAADFFVCSFVRFGFLKIDYSSPMLLDFGEQGCRLRPKNRGI